MTTSCSITALICLPLGSLIHFSSFRGKRLLVNLVQTFYSIPTVAVGLFVFILFSSAGPLGGLDLIFTPAVMVIGQVFLVMPVMLGLVISALRGVDNSISETALSLGASRIQAAVVTLRHARYAVLTAV
ncbi:ABC transporter permease, partial [Chloroflexota bacterium]